MFQLISLTVILGSMPIEGKQLQLFKLRLYVFCFAVHSQASPSCMTPPLSSQKDDEALHPNCEWRNLCSNVPAAGVAISTMECSIAQFTTNLISENCHLWGSDGSHEQMLFIYLLKITPNNLILHYFNDSYFSQQYSLRQQLCAVSNNFEKQINESCAHNSAEILPNRDSVCCYSSNGNISINFNMEVHFLRGYIEIPVDYLDCTSKSVL